MVITLTMLAPATFCTLEAVAQEVNHTSLNANAEVKTNASAAVADAEKAEAAEALVANANAEAAEAAEAKSKAEAVASKGAEFNPHAKDVSDIDWETVNHQLQQRLSFTTGSVVVILVIVAMLVFLVFNSRWNRRLELKNRQLQRERNLIAVQNKQLEIERDRAEAASKAKTAFIQSMTHEVRTPLNTLNGFTQVLTNPDMPLSDEERTEVCQHILESTRQFTRLFDDLIRMSELISNKELPPAIETRPAELMTQALDNVRPLVAPDVVLEKQCYVAEGMVINTRPDMILAALGNILGNAAKFVNLGSISLSLHQSGDNLCFSVMDTGPGVPSDKTEIIFEQFVKLDNFVQGTGLGLSVARVIAERLGGTLTIDSEYKRGAKFDFVIPIT